MFREFVKKVSCNFNCLFVAGLMGLIPCLSTALPTPGLPLYYYQEDSFINFGDFISLKLVEKIVNQPITFLRQTKELKKYNKKLLAIGSILSFARNDDVVWGSGINGKCLDEKFYHFTHLDVRAVRGPLTREYLAKNFDIIAPEIYGDPALLLPYVFTEFKKSENPQYDYIVIPHYSEKRLFPQDNDEHIVYPTDPWNQVIDKILNSKFVISSSLHGLIIAEAYGIPARLLKVTNNEPMFKYRDYYLGTNRPDFKFATSVEEALQMGGEPPFDCDLQKLYDAFPFEFWPNTDFKPLNSCARQIHDHQAVPSSF